MVNVDITRDQCNIRKKLKKNFNNNVLSFTFPGLKFYYDTIKTLFLVIQPLINVG